MDTAGNRRTSERKQAQRIVNNDETVGHARGHRVRKTLSEVIGTYQTKRCCIRNVRGCDVADEGNRGGTAQPKHHECRVAMRCAARMDRKKKSKEREAKWHKQKYGLFGVERSEREDDGAGLSCFAWSRGAKLRPAGLTGCRHHPCIKHR